MKKNNLRTKTNIVFGLILAVFVSFCLLLLAEPIYTYYTKQSAVNCRKEQKIAHYINEAFERTGLVDLIKQD